MQHCSVFGSNSRGFPGPDGKVRIVRVKTKGKDYVRPVTKLCPLETYRGQKEQNTVLFEGEDVPANTCSLTLTRSVETAEQILHALIQVSLIVVLVVVQ